MIRPAGHKSQSKRPQPVLCQPRPFPFVSSCSCTAPAGQAAFQLTACWQSLRAHITGGPLYLLSQGPSIIGGSGNFPHFVHQLDCIGADIPDPVAAVRSHRASLISSLVEIIPADERTHRFAGRPPHGGVDRNRSPPRQGERSPPVALLAPGYKPL